MRSRPVSPCLWPHTVSDDIIKQFIEMYFVCQNTFLRTTRCVNRHLVMVWACLHHTEMLEGFGVVGKGGVRLFLGHQPQTFWVKFSGKTPLAERSLFFTQWDSFTPRSQPSSCKQTEPDGTGCFIRFLPAHYILYPYFLLPHRSSKVNKQATIQNLNKAELQRLIDLLTEMKLLNFDGFSKNSFSFVLRECVKYLLLFFVIESLEL